MTQVQVAISLTALGFEPRPATAVVIEQSTGERVARVFTGLAEVRGPCPRCGAQQTYKAGGRFETGKSLDCPACPGTFALAIPGSAS